MADRYVVNEQTDRQWWEVCDTLIPHINGVGNPIARALPDMAVFIARLLNAAASVNAEGGANG